MTIINLWNDSRFRAPEICPRCEKNEVDWGDTCYECYIDMWADRGDMLLDEQRDRELGL